MTVDRELAGRMYAMLFVQRAMAERVAAADIPPNVVSGRRGQEAVPAGIAFALRRWPESDAPDWIAGSIGQKQHLAMGMELWRIIAESLGMREGYGKGKGGSVPMASRQHGVAGNHAVLGGSFGVGCGLALASQLRGEDRVAVIGFGDGMSGAGRFHESLNLAAARTLPVIFFCVNNGYAETVASRVTLANLDIYRRAAGYDIPAVQVDGNDPVAIYEAMLPAVARGRAGDGPSFIEAMTFSHWHLANEENRYLTDEEIAYWREHDPVAQFRQRLSAEFGWQASDIETMENEQRAIVDEAIRRARTGVPADPADLLNDVYPPTPVLPAGRTEGADLGRTHPISYAEAIAVTIGDWMERDRSVFVIGCDVGRHGSLKGATKGLWSEFGDQRVIDAPISEPAVGGACIGAAMAGMRPVMELGVNAFSIVAVDEVTNLAPSTWYTSGGQFSAGVVFRTNASGSPEEPLTAPHCRSLHAWYAHSPGLKVAIPADAYDAAGLLNTALLDDAPTIIVESRYLYGDVSEVPEEPFYIPFGKARIRRRGDDVTIVAMGRMVKLALEAADAAAAEGIECDVIDPRTLKPFDSQAIIDSVRRTGRLVTVDQSWLTMGFGSEVVATIAREDPRILRAYTAVALPDAPNPQNAELARTYYPGTPEILNAIRRVAGNPAG